MDKCNVIDIDCERQDQVLLVANVGKAYQVSEKEQLYIVEKILEKKREDGKWLYKIKWENYTYDECTWEPEENLENIAHLMTEFNQRWQENTQTKGFNKTQIKAARKIREENNKLKASIDKTVASKDEKNQTKNAIADIFGHYYYGDHAKGIKTCKLVEEKLIMLIEWNPRSDGSIPIPTPFTNNELKFYDPLLLINFYENRFFARIDKEKVTNIIKLKS